MSAFIPMALSAYANIQQGNAARQAGDYNAALRESEGTAAMDQSLQQEAQQRQGDRAALGKQAAAVAGAGIGTGGSAGRVMEQSAVNSELDALNIRYRGAFTKYGYDTEAGISRFEGKTRQQNARLLAAGSILKGFTTGSYTGSAALSGSKSASSSGMDINI